MKKLVSSVLAASMVMSLAACGSTASTDTASSEAASEAASTAATTEAAGEGSGAYTGTPIKIGGIGPVTGGAAIYGQAVKNAEELGIDGVLLTKLDGDARGGAALSIRAATGKPIKFVGTGEKLDMIELFHPERMASRILGMGDMLTFIEKAGAAV